MINVSMLPVQKEKYGSISASEGNSSLILASRGVSHVSVQNGLTEVWPVISRNARGALNPLKCIMLELCQNKYQFPAADLEFDHQLF